MVQPERCGLTRFPFFGAGSEKILQKEEVYDADEIFICHTEIKVLPVKLFEDKKLTTPGPVTSRISQLMKNILNYRDNRYHHWFQKLY